MLVMLAGSFSLYMGKDVSLHNRYPKEIMMNGYGMTKEGRNMMQECAIQGAKDTGVAIEEISNCTSLSFSGYKNGEDIQVKAWEEGAETPEIGRASCRERVLRVV